MPAAMWRCSPSGGSLELGSADEASVPLPDRAAPRQRSGGLSEFGEHIFHRRVGGNMGEPSGV